MDKTHSEKMKGISDMKNLRKFFVIVLSMAMSVVMTIAAFPAIGYTISVINSTHTYEVYQIFTGYVYDGIVVDIQWGVNGTGTAGEYVSQDILDELEAANGMTDREKLEVIQKYANLNPESKFGTVSADSPLKYIPAGYYLVKDIDGIFEGEDETYTTYIARVVTDIEISPKSDKTTADKKVTDVNDYTGETSVGETADYDVNDEVPFQLSATIDSEYERYAAYKLTFHDTLSEGLRFNESSVSVKVDGGERTLVNGQDYTLVTEGLSDGCTFEVKFTNLKTIEEIGAGSVITVDYTATLTSDAVIGGDGNANTVIVEYSNNPNDETGMEMGKTPEETAIVFTYQMVVNKITKNPDYDPNVEGSMEYIPLVGAEFELEKLVKNPESSNYKWVTKLL